MKVSLNSTSNIVRSEHNGVEVDARVWEGTSESGVPVRAYLIHIEANVPPTDPRHGDFQRELAALHSK